MYLTKELICYACMPEFVRKFCVSCKTVPILEFLFSVEARSTSSDTTSKENEQRRGAIEETILKKGGITFSDIAGLQEAKDALTEAFIMPLQFPQLFTGTYSMVDN